MCTWSWCSPYTGWVLKIQQAVTDLIKASPLLLPVERITWSTTKVHWWILLHQKFINQCNRTYLKIQTHTKIALETLANLDICPWGKGLRFGKASLKSPVQTKILSWWVTGTTNCPPVLLKTSSCFPLVTFYTHLVLSKTYTLSLLIFVALEMATMKLFRSGKNEKNYI